MTLISCPKCAVCKSGQKHTQTSHIQILKLCFQNCSKRLCPVVTTIFLSTLEHTFFSNEKTISPALTLCLKEFANFFWHNNWVQFLLRCHYGVPNCLRHTVPSSNLLWPTIYRHYIIPHDPMTLVCKLFLFIFCISSVTLCMPRPRARSILKESRSQLFVKNVPYPTKKKTSA